MTSSGGKKRSDSSPALSSIFGEKRNRVSDAFSFLGDVENKKDGIKGESNDELRCTTSDHASSDIDGMGNNLTRGERQQVENFNRDLKLCHQRHQADAMALLSNTATNTMFIKDYIIVEWLCESVVVLMEGDTHVLLNLKGMNKYGKNLDIGRIGHPECVREGIERGRGIEFMGRLLEDKVYGARTFRFI